MKKTFTLTFTLLLLMVASTAQEKSNLTQKQEIPNSGKKEKETGKHKFLSTEETDRSSKIGNWELRRILKGKRSKFFTVPAEYNGDSIHDNLIPYNSLAFVGGKKNNITEWIIKNYTAHNKYIRIYLKNTSTGADSLIYTLNLKSLRLKKIKRNYSQVKDTGCVNCAEVDARTFIMDMCNEELCKNTRRPMLISSGDCVRDNELKIGCNQLLSFVIINNNPLKYELEVDHKDISFNTDHVGFDNAIANLGKENKNIGSGAPGDSTKDFFKGTNTTLLKNFNASLDTLQLLLHQVQNYIALKSSESCLNESELKEKAQGFVQRYHTMFGYEGAEKIFEHFTAELKSIKIATLNAEQVKDRDDLISRSAKLVPDGIKLLKELIGKLLSVSTTYALLPIQINDDNADVIEISMKRKNISTKVSDEYKYNFRVRGGVKIDFSAGPFLSLLRDEKFTTLDRKDTLLGASGADSVVVRRIIKKQKTDNFSYMFGSLMHVYLRSGGFINGSINLGAAVTTQQRAVLLTGVSLILGKQQRFCLTGGIAFSTVKRLASPYHLDDVYEASGDVPFIEQYLSGWAFGLTYNLSKPKVVANASN